MKLNGFDALASIYDRLVQIVFGRSLRMAQVAFLDEVTPGKVLILGGGTGWIASEVLAAQPLCSVWYIDASKHMIELSRSRGLDPNRIHFIHGTEDDIPSNMKFDSVITHFYMDMFTQDSPELAIGKMSRSVAAGGNWLITDFVNDRKIGHRMLLRLMYVFFRLVSGIEARRLPDWNKAMSKGMFEKKKSTFFHDRFIETCIFENRVAIENLQSGPFSYKEEITSK